MEEVEIPPALQEAAGKLPRIYSDPVHYDVLAQMTAPADVPFLRRLVERLGGPILELGCGTGRVALELARDVEVFGVELSPQMLERAFQKAAAAGVGPTLALGDLRSFDFGRTFPTVLLTYNTINHLHDDAELAKALSTVRRHMGEGARFVIDTFQPSPAFLADAPERRRPILRYLDPYLQEEVVLHEENHYDAATQLNRIVWSYSIGGVEDARIEELTMRLYFAEELDDALRRSGFEIEEKFGDYDERPFDETSPKQLIICR